MLEPGVNASTLLTTDEQVLVGREHELTQFDEILDECRTTLVLVAGGPGVGKTSLLYAMRNHAEAKGWSTAPSGMTSNILSVTPETTEEDFANNVQAQLAMPSGQSFIEKSLGHGSVETSTDQQPLHAVVEQLRARAPVLLLIDDYQPSQAFADWFQNCFAPAVKRSQAPVILVISQRRWPELNPLIPISDRIFTLGPLQEQAIRRHFANIGRRIAPPMEEKEINAYVEAAQKEPELLVRLTRVLALGLRRDSRAARSTTQPSE